MKNKIEILNNFFLLNNFGNFNLNHNEELFLQRQLSYFNKI